MLHDLLEREGICQYDGKQLLNTVKTLARQQVTEDLKESGLKNHEAVYKLKQLAQTEEYRWDGAAM